MKNLVVRFAAQVSQKSDVVLDMLENIDAQQQIKKRRIGCY